MRKIAIAALALAISGCATSGPMKFTCNGWNEHLRTLPPSEMMKAIQAGQQPASPSLGQDQKAAASVSADSIFNLDDFPNPKDGGKSRFQGSTLLLSGGGQWGAFGVGALKALRQNKQPPLNDLFVITGVSTGGLQALFVAADGPKKTDDDKTNYVEKLKEEYEIDEEKDLVKRGPLPLAVVKGSVATLKPLRGRLEKALCAKPNPTKIEHCPMIKALSESNRVALIGFVDASTGQFQYVNTQSLARTALKGDDHVRNAQQCITGAAMASAAMPVFFQQIRVNDPEAEEGKRNYQTYFDGGVRYSVFEAKVIQDYVERQRSLIPLKDEKGDIYIIRNGPTKLLKDDDAKIDRKADALNAALKSYEILVNQIEVQSLERVGLRNSNRTVKLITADGYEKHRTSEDDPKTVCSKASDGTMFDPDFMKCLMDFGMHKFSKDKGPGWIDIGKTSMLSGRRNKVPTNNRLKR